MNEALLLLPDALLILLGFVLCRRTRLDRPVWDAVERLVYYVLFPVLLFTSVLSSPLNASTTGALALSGAGVVLAGVIASYALGHVPGVDRGLQSSGAQVAFRFNSYVALALAERLFGPAGLSWMAVLTAVAVPLANLAAVYPMARHGGQRYGRELLRNPLIVATLLGLAGNLMGLRLPETLLAAGHKLGQAGLPLGLMAVGAGLRLGALGVAPLLAGSLLGIRHLLLPLVGLALALTMPLNTVQAACLLLFAAMPTAPACYVLAVRMGGHGGFVAGLVTASTVLGMATIPMWLILLRGLPA